MDRRRNRRWPRQLDVRFWKQGEDGQAYRAISTNVSRTGIFVRTQMVLPSGSRLRLEVGHGGRAFVVEGVVMRALRAPTHLQSVMPSGMGVRFMTAEQLVAELLPGVDLQAEERIPAGIESPFGGAAAPEPIAEPEEAPAHPTASDGGWEPAATDRPSGVHPPVGPGPSRSIASNQLYPLRFRDREQFQRVFERDVETGGLFISCERPAPLDAVIQVEVAVDGVPVPPVSLQARVVHRMESPPGSRPGNLLAGMGVQFVDVGRAVEQLRSLLK